MPDSEPRRCKRLLVVTHLFVPDSCGGAPIFSDLCRGLADRGIDVTVRCAYPYYPEWKDKSGRNGFRIERSRVDGMTVERHGMFIPSNPKSIPQRLLYEGSFFLSCCRSLFDGARYDAVMVFCPLAGSVAFAGLHKMVHRRPLWLNIQDLPADAAAAGGMMSGALTQKVFRGIQQLLFNRADVWRTISPIMVEGLEKLRAHDQPILFIPDWLHPSIAAEFRSLPSKVGRPVGQPPRMLYSGNIGSKQGLLEFCKVLHAGSADFEFKIHGEGGAAAPVRDWVASSGDRRFFFGPLIDEPGFVRALHKSDLFVVTEKAGSGASFFPSKTIPGITSGTPILAVSNADSPLGSEVRKHGLGPWFSWDRCHAVSDLLATLGTRPDEFLDWQRNALRRSLFYDRERCLDLYEQTLEEMILDRTLSRTRAEVSVAPLVTSAAIP